MDYFTRIGERIEMFENADARGLCVHLLTLRVYFEVKDLVLWAR